jgi:hypothetical protein
MVSSFFKKFMKTNREFEKVIAINICPEQNPAGRR